MRRKQIIQFLGRVLAIDYGTKRCGIAVSDELHISTNPLSVEHPENLIAFLTNYIKQHDVSVLVVGEPKRLHGETGKIESEIIGFLRKFQKLFPHIIVVREDERLTSKIAQQTINDLSTKLKQRKDKAQVDKLSAALILQSYLSKTTPY